jgi:RNA polymerase sigma-70 factor, ECF subfamily
MPSTTRMLALLPASAAGGVERKETTLQQRAALERFLAGVERRAFQIARYAVRDPDDALDLVQDAMLRLARSYAHSPEAEWQLLFFRILQNRILDHQRRGSVRRRVLGFFASRDDDDEDPLHAVPGPASDRPDRQAMAGDAMTALERAIGDLPARQQQAFLLRNLEGFDVAATAAVMGCSEGSVKTHYSRAVHTLRERLGDHAP